MYRTFLSHLLTSSCFFSLLLSLLLSLFPPSFQTFFFFFISIPSILRSLSSCPPLPYLSYYYYPLPILHIIQFITSSLNISFAPDTLLFTLQIFKFFLAFFISSYSSLHFSLPLIFKHFLLLVFLPSITFNYLPLVLPSSIPTFLPSFVYSSYHDFLSIFHPFALSVITRPEPEWSNYNTTQAVTETPPWPQVSDRLSRDLQNPSSF